ncbi:MAG: molybdate ABC transporter substrate-binding protein, partial [Deltaproteobacteria bacterium]|nr:molybdate ABC transporter substrate-binding protein [Deltaproteobacteria bacterium]
MNSMITKAATVLCLLLLATSALGGDINLSVAASMKDVINELSDSYTKHHPGVKLFKNYGASGALAKQVENGAPSDVFISANEKWMDYLKDKKLVETS